MKKLPDYILRRLPRHHWKLLRDVPTWEGVLYYDPMDIVLDRPLTFYRRVFCPELDDEIIYPLRIHKTNSDHSYIKHGSKHKPMYRHFISFNWLPNLLLGKDRMKNINCHTLTMLCLTGFTIADPRHWVVDHIDGNPLNDRPSNLQVISQSENCKRSEKVREHARKTQKIAAELSRGLNNQQRHEAALKRRGLNKLPASIRIWRGTLRWNWKWLLMIYN
jgi:hypothetical protein